MMEICAKEYKARFFVIVSIENDFTYYCRVQVEFL